MDIAIRRAEAAESSELTTIAYAAKRQWGYPETWIELWAEELTIDGRYIDEHWVFVASDGAQTMGWCGISEESGEHWLDYCWVLPESAGRGIGRALVSRAFNLAAELEWSTLKVVADPNAEAFYCKMGFRRIGEHPSVPSGRRLPVLEANIANVAEQHGI